MKVSYTLTSPRTRLIAIALAACVLLTACEPGEIDCAASLAEAAEALPDQEEERILALTQRLDTAVALHICGNSAASVATAEQVLAAAAPFAGYWDHPNWVHVSHTIRGLALLDAGDLDGAIKALDDSVPDEASPQLAVHGPSFALVAAIAQRAPNSPSVAAFLDRFEILWPRGKDEIEAVRERLRAGVVDFGHRAGYLARVPG